MRYKYIINWIISSFIIFALTNRVYGKEKIIFKEDFKAGLSNWWKEGGQSVKVHDGKLYVKANPKNFDGGKNGGVCTVWCRKTISGNVQIDFDVYVLDSEIKANNINLFLFYSTPEEAKLETSAHKRKTANYSLYHKFNGYIFTYLNDYQNKAKSKNLTKARFRIRRCPGFKLLSQKFDYHVNKRRKYHVTITRKGKLLSIAVDGKVYLTAHDDNPFETGYWGFRTYRTYLWFSNITVKALAPAKGDLTVTDF